MGAAIGQASAGGRSPTGDGARTHFAPFGLALCVEASDVLLIRAVAAACRGWEAPIEPDGATLHLRLQIGPVGVGGDVPHVEVEGSRLTIRGGVEAVADAGLGQAWCRVRDAHVFDDPIVREQVLDCLVLWLVTRNGRTPLHAAAIVAEGTAILLAGPSGSGKSCLALAAHRAGFPLISDDTVYVETAPRFRIHGIPRAVHLFPEDAPPRDAGPIRLRNGKRKRAVTLPAPAQAATADRAVLCVLDRGTRAGLEPLTRDAARAALGPLEPGFDLLADDIEEVLDRIARRGAWRLRLSRDPAEAIDVLAAHLPSLCARAAS